MGHRGYPNANDIGIWQNRLDCSYNPRRILLLSPNIGEGYFVSSFLGSGVNLENEIE